MWFFCSPSLLTQHPAPCRVWGWTPAVPQQCCKALGWAPHGCRWLHSIDTISCSYFTKTSLYHHKKLGSSLGIPAPSGRSWISPDGSQLSCMRWDFPRVPEDLGTQTTLPAGLITASNQTSVLAVLYPSFGSCHLLSWGPGAAFQA